MPISKGGTLVCLPEHLESYAAGFFDELAGLPTGDLESFARSTAWLTGELNALHAFREGNGRTMTAFLTLWARDRGFDVDFRTWSAEHWMAASIAAFNNELNPMTDIVSSLYRLNYGRSTWAT